MGRKATESVPCNTAAGSGNRPHAACVVGVDVVYVRPVQGIGYWGAGVGETALRSTESCWGRKGEGRVDITTTGTFQSHALCVMGVDTVYVHGVQGVGWTRVGASSSGTRNFIISHVIGDGESNGDFMALFACEWLFIV